MRRTPAVRFSDLEYLLSAIFAILSYVYVVVDDNCAMNNTTNPTPAPAPASSPNDAHLPNTRHPGTTDLPSNSSEREPIRSDSSPDREEQTNKPTPDKNNNLAFLAGIVIPIILGIYSLAALNAAGVANEQSQVANQLALLSFCADTIGASATSHLNLSSALCEQLLTQSELFLPDIAEKLYSLPSEPDDGIVSIRDSSLGTAAALRYCMIMMGFFLAFQFVSILVHVLFCRFKKRLSMFCIKKFRGWKWI
ncbi:hypothetical protein BJX99DRAFT_221219 [Aspergillus californicus]